MTVKSVIPVLLMFNRFNLTKFLNTSTCSLIGTLRIIKVSRLVSSLIGAIDWIAVLE